MRYSDVENWITAQEKISDIDIQNLNGQISIFDDMYQGDLNHYLKCGFEAAQFIQRHVSVDTKNESINILDFPCGYGRVTRWLRLYFPRAKIMGSDTVRNGVDFSVLNFGLIPFSTSEDFYDIQLDQRFDIIWVGSLITHISESRAVQLLSFLLQKMKPDGQIFLSYIGEETEEKFSLGKNPPYGFEHKESAEEVLATFRKNGYGYSDYPHQKDYGISLISRPWWTNWATNSGDLMLQFHSRAWDNHHNILQISSAAAN
jgi:2-polyprenyl-3-methyl-5-hydroxy-6-metoxy-1,4-benzoquinol methylase